MIIILYNDVNDDITANKQRFKNTVHSLILRMRRQTIVTESVVKQRMLLRFVHLNIVLDYIVINPTFPLKGFEHKA